MHQLLDATRRQQEAEAGVLGICSQAAPRAAPRGPDSTHVCSRSWKHGGPTDEAASEEDPEKK